MKAPAPPPLPVEQSAALRERLLDEIARITEQQEAAEWARTALAAKNRLTAEDAKLVEDAFAQRLADLPEAPPENAAEDPSASTSASTRAADARQQDNGAAPGDRADGSDKSLLGLSQATPPAQQGPPALCCRAAVASSAAVSPQTHITFAHPNRGRLGARRATSSWSRSVAFTTGWCIGSGMKRRGGRMPGSIRSAPRVSFGNARGCWRDNPHPTRPT